MNELQVKLGEMGFRKSNDLAYLAAQSTSDVKVEKGSVEVDAKSVLGLLALGLKAEDLVTFRSEDAHILNEIRGLLS